VAGQPGLDDGGLAGGEVAAGQVNLQPGRHGLADPREELPELRGPVVAVQFGDHGAAGDAGRGEQAWLSTVDAVVLPVLAVFWALFVFRQVLAWRQPGGERRQQLKWLMSGTAVTIVSSAVVDLADTLDNSTSTGPALTVVFGVASFGTATLPVCMGVAILRYRLWEIDRIISRTLAYAIVTGLLVGVYAGLVLLATGVLKFHSTVAVAAATLAAAALFNPVRRRVQQIVDRRFNRTPLRRQPDGRRVRGATEGCRGP
jgi:hypothetical protein